MKADTLLVRCRKICPCSSIFYIVSHTGEEQIVTAHTEAPVHLGSNKPVCSSIVPGLGEKDKKAEVSESDCLMPALCESWTSHTFSQHGIMLSVFPVKRSTSSCASGPLKASQRPSQGKGHVTSRKMGRLSYSRTDR